MSELETLLVRLNSEETLRGHGFERLSKWVLENAPEYAARLGRVWLWADWPDNGGRIDAGIDLVAEDRDGRLWAVQAKHYDPAYAIKKADLDSFLSESSRREFSYRLLIASTDHLGPTARRTLEGQEKPVGTLLRSDLAALGLRWPRSLVDLHPARAEPKTPRPHQRQAVRDIVAGLESADRGQVVMACGTGKTLVARFLHDEMASRRTLVLVPSLSLLKQSLREWLSVGGFRYLAVCSDDTVTPDDTDAVVSSTTELGVPVTTDPGEIASFLRRRADGVVFATYQSSPRIAAAQAGRVPRFDLVVADEAHRCAGPEAGVFATVLDAVRIKARKRVFMTATPRYFTGRVRKAAEDADWEVASMDDEAKFGPVFHRLSFAQAIEQELLSDYQVVVVGVTDRSYREMAERGAFVTTDGQTVTDARTLARQIGLLRAMRNYELHRVVSFHTRIASASRFATSLVALAEWMPVELRPSGALWADHVSGKMTSGERETRLNRLRAVGAGERGILTNARCLSEGVDVPTLDGVAFIDPRRSQVDVVQAVGRAIRKARDKVGGTIIIPVFVEDTADAVEALDSSEFDCVWQVVRALRDQDDVLAEELDELRHGLGRRGTLGERPGRIVLDLPTGVTVHYAQAFDTRLVETTTSTWEFWCGVLGRYAARENHSRVPDDHVEEHYRLGKWVGKQRTAHRAGRLSAERTVRLSAFPGWIWDANDAAWIEGLFSLERFVEREHHARVPVDYVEGGLRLGQWVSTRRAEYRAGRLSAGRAARLAALPGWTWNTKHTAWEKGYLAVERFAAREHHTLIPVDHLEDDFPLGKWAAKKRTAHRTGRLSADRAARLAAVPYWTWSPLETNWEDAFGSLERFVGREHHALVLNTHIENGFRLGQWVSEQRTARRVGRLSAERTARLVALDGWAWDANDAAWEKGFRFLERFAAREHHTFVHQRHVEDGYRLDQWVSAQRATYRQGRLSDERMARLTALSGWRWTTKDAAWVEGYSRLERFVEREHHARVPTSHIEDDYPLGRWVADQRVALGAGELSGERAARLFSLPGWGGNALETAWAKGYSVLDHYAAREGHARVPTTHVEGDYPLGQWVSNQRKMHGAGRLSHERAARLALLAGWTWNTKEADWEEAFSCLQRFVEREHHARVPHAYIEGEHRLGAWVSNQRNGHREGRLSDERAARLSALPGWTWNTEDAAWEEGYSRLKCFLVREGHGRVPQIHVEDGHHLGMWVSHQRRNHAKGRLSAERAERLGKLPGWVWNTKRPNL